MLICSHLSPIKIVKPELFNLKKENETIFVQDTYCYGCDQEY